MSLLPFKMDGLTEEMQKKAEVELNETEDTRRTILSELRKRISENPKLQKCRTDEEYLIRFLRARKFQIERTTVLLQNFYSLRKNYSDIYQRENFEGFQEAVKKGFVTILPYRDEEGCAILYLNTEKWDTKTKSVASVSLDLVFTLILTSMPPASQVCGIKILYNLKTLSWNILPDISLKLLTMVTKCYSNSLPIRLKGIEVMHESPVVYYLYNIVKFLLPPKIRSRIHFHNSNLPSLHEKIPAHLLPPEFGGSLQLQDDFVLQQFPDLENQYHEYMEDSEYMGTK